MNKKNVTLEIPFELLLNAINSLGIDEKRRLWQLLEEEIAEAEADLLEEEPSVQAEIESARAAYEAGDYQTIDEYIASRLGKTP
jgi:hypothetical protein